MKDSIRPQRLRIAFDDKGLIASAGMIQTALLLGNLAVGDLTDERLTLQSAAAAPNSGDKLLTLLSSAVAGGDCIDDADMLRSGGTARILGFKVKAPSTLGTFLRGFRWFNVRQLDGISRQMLKERLADGSRTGF